MKKANDYEKFASVRQQEILSGEKLSHVYVVKPMMKKLLPSLRGQKVLMLGCGTGDESLLLKERGAKELVGIDTSVESIALAKQTYPEHTFSVGDMHTLAFKEEEFDFVYSSLAIHYSSHPQDVVKEIFRVLKPRGALLFCVGHPVKWAAEEIFVDGSATRVIGFSEEKKNPRLYGSYSSYVEYEHHFPNDEILRFWVGSPSFYFGLLKDSGFSVENFVESSAISDAKEKHPYYFERYREFPQFMAFLAKKS